MELMVSKGALKHATEQVAKLEQERDQWKSMALKLATSLRANIWPATYSRRVYETAKDLLAEFEGMNK